MCKGRILVLIAAIISIAGMNFVERHYTNNNKYANKTFLSASLSLTNVYMLAYIRG